MEKKIIGVFQTPEREQGVYETYRSNELVNSHMYDDYSQNRKVY